MSTLNRHANRNHLSPLPVIAMMALLMLLPCALAGKGNSRGKSEKWADGADRRKADYIFMEAMRRNATDSDGEYFELLRRAVELDSSDTHPGMTLGYYYMALGQEDTTLATRGYNMMRRHFTTHPDDYYGAIFYGMVNNQLGNNNEAVRVWQTLDSLHPDKPDVTLKLAQALQSTRDTANLRRSVSVLNRIERAEGVDIGLTSHKVRALMALRDTAGTLNEIESLLASSRPNATNILFAGDVFMALNCPDSAIAYYNRACDIDPTNGMGYYKRAEFYRERGDSVGFDREVFEAVKQDGLDLEVKLDIFTGYIRQLYADSLQRPRIQSIFDALLLQNPHEPQVRDLYSSYLVAIDDFRGAAEQQEIALDTDPSDANRWRSAISLFGRAEDYEKAVETGRRGMHYLPDDALLTFYTSTALAQLERNDEALEMLHKALEQTDEADKEMRSTILCTIGDVLYKQEKPDSAFVYYDRALEYNPDNLLALNNCAYFMAEEGIDLDKAERMSSICVRQQPDNDTALDTYAWILFKKKNYAEAKAVIDRALALEADDPQADVLHHAGDIYYMNGEPESALEFWEEALKLEPDNKLLKKKVKNKTHYYE